MFAWFPCEKETVIRWDEEWTGIAELWTCSRPVLDRLKKASLEPVRADSGGWWFELPKSAIRIKPGKHTIRIAGKR